MKKVVSLGFAIMMLAAIASAQGHGGPPPGPGFGPGGDGGRDLIVASNGTVFITDTIFDTSTRTATTTIKAISATGAQLWTATLSNGRGLTLSGSNLISLNETNASDGTVSSTLTAISTSSGTVAWTRTLSGRVMSLQPFSGGTYAIVVVPAATSGGSATRSLVAIGNDGSVLWTVSLT